MGGFDWRTGHVAATHLQLHANGAIRRGYLGLIHTTYVGRFTRFVESDCIIKATQHAYVPTVVAASYV